MLLPIPIHVASLSIMRALGEGGVFEKYIHIFFNFDKILIPVPFPSFMLLPVHVASKSIMRAPWADIQILLLF